MSVVVIYIAICVVCKFSYNYILRGLIPREQIIYSNLQDEKAAEIENFVVFLEGTSAVFSKIKKFPIAPFSLVEIPQIEYSYTYDIESPDQSVYSDGKLVINISEHIENEIFIAKEHRLVGQETGIPRYETYYFGFIRGKEIAGVTNFELNYPVENGSIFIFSDGVNQDFRSENFNIVYY